MITLPSCRTDSDAFFKESGYYSKGARWPHYPLLVFVERPDDGVAIHILDSAAKVSHSMFSDSTPCMQQWGGQWKSDFFTFTLGEARAALA